RALADLLIHAYAQFGLALGDAVRKAHIYLVKTRETGRNARIENAFMRQNLAIEENAQSVRDDRARRSPRNQPVHLPWIGPAKPRAKNHDNLRRQRRVLRRDQLSIGVLGGEFPIFHDVESRRGLEKR